MNPKMPATLFLADWMDVVFIHFRVAPGVLQPHVPLDLDLFRGNAYVSLVSFTQKRLRPTVGGRLAALLAIPLAEHEFLNVRTYVRHGDNRGIYFLAEWIPNRLAHLIGPTLYGLPYRLGQLRIRGSERSVNSRGSALEFTTEPTPDRSIEVDLDTFLVDRYIAYTRREDVLRRFDVTHDPWGLKSINVMMRRSNLLDDVAPFLRGIAPCSAQHSVGVRNVHISIPQRIDLISRAALVPQSRYRLPRFESAGCP